MGLTVPTNTVTMQQVHNKLEKLKMSMITGLAATDARSFIGGLELDTSKGDSVREGLVLALYSKIEESEGWINAMGAESVAKALGVKLDKYGQWTDEGVAALTEYDCAYRNELRNELADLIKLEKT